MKKEISLVICLAAAALWTISCKKTVPYPTVVNSATLLSVNHQPYIKGVSATVDTFYFDMHVPALTDSVRIFTNGSYNITWKKTAITKGQLLNTVFLVVGPKNATIDMVNYPDQSQKLEFSNLSPGSY